MSYLRAGDFGKVQQRVTKNVDCVVRTIRQRSIAQGDTDDFERGLRLLGTSGDMAQGAASVSGFENPAPHANEGGRAHDGVGVPALTGTGVRKRTPTMARPLKEAQSVRTKKYRRSAVVRRKQIRDANLGGCCFSHEKKFTRVVYSVQAHFFENSPRGH
ncbi:hypothetical protein [Burkholderia dolosa]|uniref:hypothetical protein n=1 Tax=Burkholderia dolosa TaxID=152500 RepID=UPI0027D29852|nr:hypothetical protein [Burkholderia dolosa]